MCSWSGWYGTLRVHWFTLGDGGADVGICFTGAGVLCGSGAKQGAAAAAIHVA